MEHCNEHNYAEYFLEVDVKYQQKLRGTHNDLPFLTK